MEKKMSAEETLAYLKKEVKDLDKARKSYSIQSEWHRLIYDRQIKIEALEMALKITK